MGSEIVVELFTEEEYKELWEIQKKHFPKEYEKVKEKLGREPWNVEKRPTITLDFGDYFESSDIEISNSSKIIYKNQVRDFVKVSLLMLEKAIIERNLRPIQRIAVVTRWIMKLFLEKIN